MNEAISKLNHHRAKVIDELRAENKRLRTALAEIAKGEGRFSTDHLTHASNTIEDMKQLAVLALTNGDQA